MLEETRKDEKIIKDERRLFLGPDDITEYFIAPPNAEDIRGADWAYSKVYTKCLVEGITTSAEMMDILRRRDIIGPEFEQRAMELTELLNNKIEALEMAKSFEEKRTLAVEVHEAREELFQWNQRLSGPMSNTCEQIADDARLEHLTSCIVQNKDDSKVWESYEDFLKNKNQALTLRARFEVMLYLQGLESDFLDNTPEAVAMKEVEADIIDKAKEALKAVKAVSDEKNKDEKKTKSRKTVKKTTTNKKKK